MNAAKSEDSVTVVGRRGSRWRVLGVILGLLILAETTAAIGADQSNAEIRERDELIEVAARLHEVDGSTLLFLGSSTASTLLDTGFIEQALTQRESIWTIGSALTERTSVGTWSAIYDQHYARQNQIPDVVVIPFVREQLADQSQIDWAAIGNLHTSWESLPHRWRSAPDVNAKLDVAASWASALVGNRRWLASIWSDAMPNHSSVPRQETGSLRRDATFEGVRNLLQRISDDGAQVILVALPTLRPYDLPPGLDAALGSVAGSIIDLRAVDGIDEESFTGARSLTSDGIELVSAAVAASILLKVD